MLPFCRRRRAFFDQRFLRCISLGKITRVEFIVNFNKRNLLFQSSSLQISMDESVMHIGQAFEALFGRGVDITSALSLQDRQPGGRVLS